ncbi:MAG: carbohydrate-binding family 9-like protein [Bacteroidia bacterium]|nr:carbohydrate-binding family 9-like protein [Bacteroidia bacterium]
MKYIFALLMTFACFSCKNNNAFSVDVSKDIVIPKTYIVTKTIDSIMIDGRAEELSWEYSKFTDDFIDIEGVKTPKFQTKVKLLWDDNYLYIFSEMEEPHIWGYLKQRDTIIFYNNDFEVFIDPSGQAQRYGEIEINALNTVWDLHLNKPYRVGGNADFNWNLIDLKSAVKIYGTLNNPNDIDSLWTVEMAVPLKPIIELKNHPKTYPKEGEQWRINFSRVEWNHDIINGTYYRKKENGSYLKEYNWVWSSQKVINMHEPEKWGFIQFSEASSSDNVEFIKDEDLHIKQTAFALFRKTRFGELKYLMDNDIGFSQELKVTYSDRKSIKAIFRKTENGFNYELRKSTSVYMINQEGILNIL